ncbi:hypothetical protein C6370_12705 [Bacillus atrophaeus]|uniref:Phage protein n=2 Tax=Bacillus atrophaeus TaxID=1452 RepID=A0ABM5LZ89_BACA1|nr:MULTISPECIES: hypothetical protein [Bacillus]AMR61983.1 hypothetical protein A1D11_06065 [Bacillus subtilis subsp. globigii]ADP33256.1 hypothetical protein BATR1942_11625 [Bacillus atrophaeus 1942]AIK49178.1 hypothetical protein DJ95_2209 [Bacillus atrophaeus subsp. globigii]AKL85960.1 hypothetical protein D068_cds27520 [Bacillus atrophaeus UCMB-5137]ARW07704.1 hypothetical protein S101359_02699 [Bacillus atrophaeus]
MKTYRLTFHMNNGEELTFEITRPATYDFFKKIDEANSWFKMNDDIINLRNVNSIKTEEFA